MHYNVPVQAAVPTTGTPLNELVYAASGVKPATATLLTAPANIPKQKAAGGAPRVITTISVNNKTMEVWAAAQHEPGMCRHCNTVPREATHVALMPL